MRRLSVWIAGTAVLLLAIFVAAAILNMRQGDPALYPPQPGETTHAVYVVSFGYHSGLVLRRDDLMREAATGEAPALAELLDRFRDFDFLEFGWGDEEFYQHVRVLEDLRYGETLRALFRAGNKSVLHVVGLRDEPRALYRRADIVRLFVTDRGLAHMAGAIDQSFALNENGRVEEMGPGLYGPSLFYHANGTFNLFNVCNHWVAHVLQSAGLPTNPFLATLPYGLFWDLSLRAHAQALPR